MIRVAVIGATGRTGSRVVRAILERTDFSLVVAATHPSSRHLGDDIGPVVGVAETGLAVTPLRKSALRDAEVVIDFSTPAALSLLLDVLGERALVTGTTGLDEHLHARLTAQAERSAVLTAANFSTGVTLLLDLAHRASRALSDFDVEIVEAHHRHKVDAPSGTAIALAEQVAQGRGASASALMVHGRSGAPGPRPPGEIGMHALRGGGVVGEHQVHLVSETERITLGHTAFDRSTFAQGAVRAARWIAGRPPGRYTMSDVLELDDANR